MQLRRGSLVLLVLVMVGSAAADDPPPIDEDTLYARERARAHVIEEPMVPALTIVTHGSVLLNDLALELEPDDALVLKALVRTSRRSLLDAQSKAAAPALEQMCEDLGTVSVYDSAGAYRSAQVAGTDALVEVAERQLAAMSGAGLSRVLDRAERLAGERPRKRRDWVGLAVDAPDYVARFLDQSCVNFDRLSSEGRPWDGSVGLTSSTDGAEPLDAAEILRQIAEMTGTVPTSLLDTGGVYGHHHPDNLRSAVQAMEQKL